MPVISSMTLPRPNDFEEFERVTLAALAQRWQSPNLQKNGRKGQKQAGVDIYGVDEIGRPVAIQCKNYAQAPKLALIKKEIANAGAYKGKLGTLYIATSADHDSKLQQEVRLLSEARVALDKFAVAIIFWDEIVDGLALNPQVMKNFYPQIHLPAPTHVNKERLLAALELGYYGSFLWDYIELIYGEVGWMAQEDTDQIEVILRIVERRVIQLLDDADQAVIGKSLGKVGVGCNKKRKSQKSWHRVEDHAKRIATRVKAATTFLDVAEGNALGVGMSLGTVYLHADDKPKKAARDDIQARIAALAPGIDAETVAAAFRKVRSKRAGYQWAPPIYTSTERQIRSLPA